MEIIRWRDSSFHFRVDPNDFLLKNINDSYLKNILAAGALFNKTKVIQTSGCLRRLEQNTQKM